MCALDTSFQQMTVHMCTDDTRQNEMCAGLCRASQNPSQATIANPLEVMIVTCEPAGHQISGNHTTIAW